MKHNPFEKYDKPSEYLLPGEEEAEALERVSSRISATQQVGPIIPFKWMIGIAASILMAAIIFLLQPKDSIQIAERHFEAYKNYKEEATRGSLDISEAYKHYENEDFASAIASFELQDKLSGLDALYYAVSLQGMGEWLKAGDILERDGENIPEQHQDALDYHLALSYVALNSKDKARSLIEQVIAVNDSQFLPKLTKLKKHLD